jgi:RNase P subunit RPR2
MSSIAFESILDDAQTYCPNCRNPMLRTHHCDRDHTAKIWLIEHTISDECLACGMIIKVFLPLPPERD